MVFWWERMDSNHRSRRQQIYSLPPLAARELSHVLGINKSLSLFVELVMGLEPATCWLQISCSTNWATPASYLRTLFKKWWELQGSNLWHPACKADALPAELNSHTFWSGWQDSNLRPSGPKPDALPNCATSRRMFSVVLLSSNDLYIIAKIFSFVNLDYSRLCLFFAYFTFVFSFLRSFSTLFIFFIKL